MIGVLRKISLAAVFAVYAAAEALALPPIGGGGDRSGGHAPEIDGAAGLTTIALIACVGLYLYNRYRR
jgi:hypothetical protein